MGKQTTSFEYQDNITSELLVNTSDIRQVNKECQNEAVCAIKKAEESPDKIFSKYKIKDIVFLAMMAAAMLVTGAIMPLVGQIPLFGIIQLCLGLQFSIFPVIGMMKVRKFGSLIFISIFCGALLIFMNTIMFFCLLLCAVLAELLVLVVFRGYKKDGACLMAGTIYFPLTLPFLYLWYKYLYTWTGEEGQAVSAFVGSSGGVAAAISFAVLAVCFVGALVGTLIARELRNSGVMKK